MNMKTESQTLEQLTNRLLELGFSKSSLRSQVKTSYGKYIDLVAFEFDKPKIVFEVKPLLSITSLLESLNEEQIRFNSSIRQVQSLAKDIGAPYFAVYDGNMIYWFGVDESGRPKKLPNPVLSQSTDESRDESLWFAQALYRLNDIGFAEFPFMFDDLLLCMGLSVFAWSMYKKGDAILRDQLLSENPKLYLVDDFFAELGVVKNSYSKDFFSRAFSLLDQINLPDHKGREFVGVIDDYLEFALAKQRIPSIRLPIWISEFMGNLGLKEDTDVVLDLHSTFDDIASTSYGINREAKFNSVVTNALFYVWTKAKRHLLNIDSRHVKIYRRSPILQSNLLEDLNIKSAAVVFVAPPFGVRVPSDRQGKSRRSEEIYIEAAIDIVKNNGTIIAILPEGFLSSKSHQESRERVMETATIKAIFSLDQFMPGTGIKASIVVLVKSNPKPQDKIIFARIQQSDIEISEGRTKFIQKGSRLQKILEFYKKYQADNSITTRLKDVFQIPTIEVTPANWTLTSYIVQKKVVTSTEYPLVRFDDIASFSKGSPLKLSKSSGTIPVIGPGAVRAFLIDQSKFDFTEQALLTNNPAVSQAGDILVNAVGPYRGHSALVEHGLEGISISRNIIIIKPSESKVLPEYLSLILNSESVQQQLRELSTGSVILQLTIGKLKELLIPVPPIETQEKIISNVQKIRKEIASSEKKIQELQLEVARFTKQLQSMIDSFESSGENDD